MPRKLTTEEFIEKAIAVHGNAYGYDLAHYNGSHTPVEINCKKHGTFNQTPNMHLQGKGCKKCGTERVVSKRIASNRELKAGFHQLYTPVGSKAVWLSKGFFALVDDDDYERVSMFNWSVMINNGCAYAVSQINGRTIRMHRFILNLQAKSKIIDHINHNGLDNRRSNLRECTYQQNMMNKRAEVGGSSIYKGVSLDKRRGTWKVQIRFNGKSQFLGSYETEAQAARVYDLVAEKSFGEFACLNF